MSEQSSRPEGCNERPQLSESTASLSNSRDKPSARTVHGSKIPRGPYQSSSLFSSGLRSRDETVANTILSDYRLQYLFLSCHDRPAPHFCMPTLAGSGDAITRARHRMAETLVGFDKKFGCDGEVDKMSLN